MRRVIYFALFFWSGVIYSKSLGFLDNISKPLSFDVLGEKIYVLEESSVKVFSRQNLQMTSTIGREGEGPGEIKKTPFYRNSMKIIDGKVFIDSVDKILFFSPEGQLLQEVKKRAFLMTRMFPVGDNFVAKGLDRTDGRKEFIVVSLYNRKMEKIKELFRQISPIQPTTGQMIPDSVYFSVIDNTIFIDNSTEGFNIQVFDHMGEKLRQISKDVNKRAVTSGDRERVMEEYKNDPLVKRIGFENLKKSVDFIFPSHFPAIMGLETAARNLIIRTPHVKEGRDVFHIINTEGKLIRDIALSPLTSDSGLDRYNAIDEQLISIRENLLYSLRENDNEERWELFGYPLIDQFEKGFDGIF